MIEISVRDLLDSSTTLQEIMQKTLKGRAAFLLARIAREVDKEYTSFNTTRMQLIQKYGEKDDNGNLITDDKGNNKIPQSAIEDFNKEVSDLLETKVQLNVNAVPLDDLNDIDFTPQQMLALEKFIEE